MTNRVLLKKFLREFKRELPLKKYFIKYANKKITDRGLCYGPYVQKSTGRKYVHIVIGIDTFPIQIEALMHEYAHAMMLDRGKDDSDEFKSHNLEWGKCYSEVYRVFLKHFNLIPS